MSPSLARVWRGNVDRLSRLAARHLARRSIMARNPRPIVTFTFDDIDATAASTGASILEAHGARGTFYVAGALCEQSGARGPFASLEACRELGRRGHDLACHTFSHRPVRTFSARRLVDDIRLNAERICGDSGVRLQHFAFPYNAPTLRAKRTLARQFSTCRGGIPGINAGSIDLAFLRAVEINDADMTPAAAQLLIDAAVAGNGWLIFFTHDVKPGASRHGCSPQLFEAIVERAIASPAAVLSMREAYACAVGRAA